jgi:hypothetical protein
MDNQVTVVGYVEHVSETKFVGAKGNPVQEVVVDTGTDFNSLAVIQFFGDQKTALIDGLKAGDAVRITGFVGGRKWVNPQGVTRYFGQIDGVGVERSQAAPAPTPVPQPAPANLPPPTTATPELPLPASNNTQDDDIPF